MDEKVKVCLLSDSFPPSVDGVANCVLNYADIIQRKCGCAVVAAPSYPKVVDEYPYQVIRYPSIDTTKSVGYRTALPYWPSSFRELIKCDFDVIHTHCPSSPHSSRVRSARPSRADCTDVSYEIRYRYPERH
jgi:hypothetical protein